MAGSYIRAVSPFEKIYLAKADSGRHFTNQGVIEGTGRVAIEQWEKAVQAATLANLGSRVILKRKVLKQYWVPGGAMPRVRLVRDCDWDGQSSEGIPYLPDGLCPVKGPACEVVILEGRDRVRIVLSTLHAAMDGVGTVHLAKDIFRALRGEELLGFNATTTDLQVAGMYRGAPHSDLNTKCISPFPQVRSHEQGGIWVRKKIPHIVSRIIPRLCQVITSEALRHREGKVRFMVPVNLRRRIDNVRSTGNLTGNIFLDVDARDGERKIHMQLLEKLRNHQDCNFPAAMTMLRYLPSRMIHQSLLDQDIKAGRSGLHHFTGLITHLGRGDAKEISGGEFVGDSWFAVNSMSGPGLPPLFVAISEFVSEEGSHSNLIIGAPKSQATNADLEELSKEIVQAVFKS